MTTGHIVLEDATRPLITVKIGYSMTIQQMILKKEKEICTAMKMSHDKGQRNKGLCTG